MASMLVSVPSMPAAAICRHAAHRRTCAEAIQGALLMEVAIAIVIMALAAAAAWPRTLQQLERQLQTDRAAAERLLLWSRRAAASSGSCKRLCLTDDPHPSDPAQCLGPSATLQLQDCSSDRLLLRVELHQSLGRWKGLRAGKPAGFDAQGRPLAVSGSLYLCSPDAENHLLARYIVNRSGRIRTAEVEAGLFCPDD